MHAYQTLPDQVLFDLIKLGDDGAFKAVYDRYFDILYIHAYKKLNDSEDARDVVQEVFTNIWGKRKLLVLKTSLPAYLYIAVRNRIFNILAHKRVQSTHISSLQHFVDQGVCQTDHLVREKELRAVIEEEIAALPQKMQEIFEMSRNQYLSHKEIASALDLSEHTVKKQVNNALRILRAKLGVLFLLLFFI